MTKMNIVGRIDSSLKNEFRLKRNKKISEKDAYMYVLKMLQVGKSHITYMLLAYTLLSLTTFFWDKTGFPCKFVMMLIGKSGSLKTTLAKLFTQIYDRNNLIVPSSFKDTQAAIEAKTFQYKDCVLLVDDLHPTQNIKERNSMQGILDFIHRRYGDQISKSRMTGVMGRQKEFPARGLCLVTAEDCSLVESASARCLIVNMKKDDVNIESLSKFQNNPLKYGAFIYYFIQWIAYKAEDMNSFVQYLKYLFINRRQYLQEYEQKLFSDSHMRNIETATWIYTAFYFFIDYGEEKGFIDVDEIGTLDKTLEAAIKYNILSSTTQTQTPIKMFTEFLSEGISSHKLKFLPIKHVPSEGVHGWIDDNYLYLLESTIYNELCSFYKRQGRLFPLSSTALFNELSTAGYIEQGERIGDNSGNSRNTKKKKVYGNIRPRVIYFKKSLLQLYKKNI